MMRLREELESLQQKLTLRLRLQAVLNSAVVVLAVLSVLSVVDFQFRPELSLIRYLFSILFWVSLGGVIIFWIFPTWFRRTDLVDLAFAFEDVTGQQDGEIAAAVDLDRHSLDRHSVVSSDFPDSGRALSAEILNREIDHPLKLRSWAFLAKGFALCSFVLYAILVSPTSSLTAVSRIGFPNNEQKWPQLTKLNVFDQRLQQIAPGRIISLIGRESSQFYVMDEYGKPPAEVLLEIRRQSQPVKQILLRGRNETLSGFETKTVFGFRLVPNPSETMQFRVVGGDDYSMPWTTLLRELKPAVRTLSCQVTAPNYLQLEPRSMQNWSGLVHVPAGSGLTFDLELNRPVAAIEVRDNNGSVIWEAEHRSSRYSFSFVAESAPEHLLNYEIHVKTSSEETATSWLRVKRLQIEPVDDRQPQVSLLQPLKEQKVTRAAVVPIQASATDDYGLQSFRIVIASKENYFLPAEGLQHQRISSIKGSLKVHLTHAQVGEYLDVFAEASDFNTNVQPVTSPAIRLHVVSVKEKESEIHQDLKRITSEVSEGLAQQREIQFSTQELFKTLTQKGATRREKEVLNLLEIKQNQLSQRIQESLGQGLTLALITEMEVNRVANSALSTTLQMLQNSYQGKIKPTLELSLAALVSTQKSLDSNDEISLREISRSDLLDHLDKAITRQDDSIEAISDLMNQLNQWIDSSDVQTQWQLLQADLRQALEQLKPIAQRTISISSMALTQSQIDRLNISANEHRQLATRVAQLTDKLALANTKTWRLLGRRLKEEYVAEELNNSGVAIKKNKVLTAIEIDQKLLDVFAEIARQVASQEANSVAELIDRLQTIQRQLKALIVQQAALNVHWLKDAATERIRQEQLSVRNQLIELAEQIESFGIAQVGSLFQTYSKHAGTLLEIERSKDLTEVEKQVLGISDSLKQIQQLIADSLNRLQKRDQDQVLSNLKDLAIDLVKRQRVATADFQEFFLAAKEGVRLSRGQRRALLKIAEIEQDVSEALAPFQSSISPGNTSHQPLIQAIELTGKLAWQLEQGQFKASQLEMMRIISTHLLTLSQLGESHDQQHTSNGNLPLSKMVRKQFEQLLQRQTELLLQEKNKLATGGSLTSEEIQLFAQEQAEIDAALKQLFEAMPLSRTK